ncbi:transcriptional adapter 2-alpha-like [Tigriopus californicus]|nr:transcriptional adapter 2-alpha-like [Tigriopus californicus]
MDSSECCSSCYLVLRDPYIQCQECPPNTLICTSCFAKGREFQKHRSDHEYSVVKNDFFVLEPDWSAHEEKELVAAVIQRGLGNWDDIAKVLVKKTPDQCQHHFQKYYIENHAQNLLDVWEKRREPSRRDQPVVFNIASEIPLRPVHGSAVYKDLAGYNAARGDFEFEIENGAERNLRALDYETMKQAVTFLQDERNSLNSLDVVTDSDAMDEQLVSHLQLSAAQVYNNKLKARQMRKRIVKEHGLLNKARTTSLTTTYHALCAAGPHYEHLFKLGRLMCAFDFDFVLEGLQHELTLRQQILHMQDYRRNGLKKFLSTAVFTKLKAQRRKMKREVPQDRVTDWIYGSARSMGKILPSVHSRRITTKMDIVDMPSYDKLTDEERYLCSDARVTPENFLEMRELMIEECKKNNGLTLAGARPVFKIDVNKTRRCYDYFLSKNLIYKPK